MNRRSSVLLVFPIVLTASIAQASNLPPVKISSDNEVPACATPGRMGAYLKARNGDLDPRFDGIATAYMRVGEELGVRWDYAFFQMLLETGNLSYKRSNGRAGDVRPTQNNFAGLGAIGRGEPGESFPDVESGVKAHLQHLLMYSGETISDPIADRTRKVQAWGILTSWQKSFKGPITFTDLAHKWAPGDGSYARQIESVAARFYDRYCEVPDPAPQLVQEARKDSHSKVAKVSEDASAVPDGDRISGAQLARRALERAKAEGDGTRSTLGAANIAKGKAAEESAAADIAKGDKQLQMVSAGAAAKQAAPKNPAQRARAGCRVFTASYGGQKSLIIKAQSEQYTNYTVLDVNEAQEAREVEAYIAAYAKGGQKVGEFSNQLQALDKAFELCPEG